MATKGKSKSRASSAGGAGKKKKGHKKHLKRREAGKKYQAEKDPSIALALATRPLIELFSVVDDVFTEDDAFLPGKMLKGFGRIYRAWKKCRQQLDGRFNEEKV